MASDRQSSLGNMKLNVLPGKVERICEPLGLPLLYGTCGAAAHSIPFINWMNLRVYQYLCETGKRFVPHNVIRHIAFRVLCEDLRGQAEIMPILLNFDGVTHHVFSSDALGCIGEDKMSSYAAVGSGMTTALSILRNNYNESATEVESIQLIRESILMASELLSGCGGGYIIWKVDSSGVISLVEASNEKDLRSGLDSGTRA